MYENLALFGVFVLIYSTVAGAVERSWISGPMIFVVFGVLVGPMVFDLHTLNIDQDSVRGLAELTLALVLFNDAAGANRKALKQTRGLRRRLLFIGLPLTLLLGFGFAVLLFDGLSLFALAILATMLAPTDAALGKAVVSNKVVPVKIRESLSAESGLNDGICVPILLLFLELALGHEGGGSRWTLAVHLIAKEIGIGLAVGLGLTFATVQLLKLAQKRQWLTHIWIQVPVVTLALSCFGIAQAIGGSGFIAAFMGGILFGILEKDEREDFLPASEGVGEVLALMTWAVFGSYIVAQAIGDFGWKIMLYSVLSLTVIRLLPVYLSLFGSGIDREGKLFIGWFGPRGLASIVFAVIVLNSDLPNTGPLAMTVTCTVILSIIGHGMTANPWAKAYGERRRLAKDATVSQ